jgi:hypothetical protein
VFGRKFFKSRKGMILAAMQHRSSMIETLEDRRLLSASVHHAHAVHHAAKHTHAARTASVAASVLQASTNSKSSNSSSSSNTTSSEAAGILLDTIEFNQTPAAVQTALKSLAASDSLAAPTSSQTVYLSNSDGIETYSLVYTSSGTVTRLTVDQNGKSVTAPTDSTTTWATLSGTGTGSDAAAAAEISKIATALALTAPTSTTTVNVGTASNGAVTYSVRLISSSSSSSGSSSSSSSDYFGDGGTTISVDASGNPVGRQELPFSVLPIAIQNGINAHVPAGAAALSSTSTQTVDVRTANGETFYSTNFTVGGTTTTVTVDSTGVLATLPTTTTTTYSALETSDAAAAMEIQTLATANGAGTVSGSQVVTVYNEGNGTTIYSVSLTATNSVTSNAITLTISVDQAGNPTVPPGQDHHGECGAGGGSSDGETDATGDFGRRGHGF